MKESDILKLAGLIEDLICFRVDIDTFDEILPKVSTVLYNRYCKDAKGGIVPPNQGEPIVNEAIGEMKFTPKRGKAIIKMGKVIIKMGGKELIQ